MSEKFIGTWHKPNRHNLALTFVPFCSARVRVAGRHATTPTFSFQKCLVWLCLSFSARSLSIGKTYQREQTSILCYRASKRSSFRRPASQDLRRYLVFQLFGSGKSTLGVIVLLHSGGSRPTCFVQPGRRTRLTTTITPTPSENIIDLDIKRGCEAPNKIPCMLNSQMWFWRPNTFLPYPG